MALIAIWHAFLHFSNLCHCFLLKIFCYLNFELRSIAQDLIKLIDLLMIWAIVFSVLFLFHSCYCCRFISLYFKLIHIVSCFDIYFSIYFCHCFLISFLSLLFLSPRLFNSFELSSNLFFSFFFNPLLLSYLYLRFSLLKLLFLRSLKFNVFR